MKSITLNDLYKLRTICIIVLTELDFLLKRQLAWEDSFRNLYYMLRKSLCDIFYGNCLT